MKNTLRLLVLALAFGASTYLVSAQDEGGRRGGGDPQQFRERMMERMKTELKATDQEWKAIAPLVEKVMTKQRDAMAGRFGGMMGMRGGPPRGGEGRDQGDRREGDRRGADRMGGSAEVEALRTALQSESTAPAELKAKMTALRESRTKAESELKQAREDLRKVLTVRQEAQLVLTGLLD